MTTDNAELVRRLRDNADYLSVVRSDKDMTVVMLREAAAALTASPSAALIAENAELRRLIDGIDEERRAALDLCVERNKQIQSAESALAEANRKLDVARAAALEEAAKIAESNDAWPQEGNDIAQDIRRAALSQITNAEGGPERSRPGEAG